MVYHLAGEKHGRLLVVSLEPERDQKGRRLWSCICDCGGTAIRTTESLLQSKRTGLGTCGCRPHMVKHGESKGSREFQTWSSAKGRCYNPNNKKYPRYGGRGISMCERWRSSFPNFLQDMGRRPTPKHSLDRINLDGNYEPTNCRWATSHEQARNTSYNIFVEVDGNRLCLTDAANLKGIRPSKAIRRVRRGWTPEQAIEISPRQPS